MKKTLKITLLVIVYLLAFSTSVEAYTADFTGTPTSVNSEETFTVKITVDEATTLANSHIKYDSSLFTFVEATQTNLSAAIYQSEGEVSWMYTDLNANSTGVKTFEFKFKAKKVTEDKTGTFQMSDAVFITVGEKTYEGTNVKGDKNIAVTVKAASGNTTTDKNTTTNNNTTNNTTTNNTSKNNTTSSLSSKNNTTTSGSKTNTTSTTTYNATSNNVTSDKTTTEKDSLPKTGESTTKTIVLIAGVAFIALAINFKRKANELF